MSNLDALVYLAVHQFLVPKETFYGCNTIADALIAWGEYTVPKPTSGK